MLLSETSVVRTSEKRTASCCPSYVKSKCTYKTTSEIRTPLLIRTLNVAPVVSVIELEVSLYTYFGTWPACMHTFVIFF